jgi:hypothetical protein
MDLFSSCDYITYFVSENRDRPKPAKVKDDISQSQSPGTIPLCSGSHSSKKPDYQSEICNNNVDESKSVVQVHQQIKKSETKSVVEVRQKKEQVMLQDAQIQKDIELKNYCMEIEQFQEEHYEKRLIEEKEEKFAREKEIERQQAEDDEIRERERLEYEMVLAQEDEEFLERSNAEYEASKQKRRDEFENYLKRFAESSKRILEREKLENQKLLLVPTNQLPLQENESTLSSQEGPKSSSCTQKDLDLHISKSDTSLKSKVKNIILSQKQKVQNFMQKNIAIENESKTKYQMSNFRKNKSPVWDFFTRESSGVTATCNICSHSASCDKKSGTNLMRSHLQHVHPHVSHPDLQFQDNKRLVNRDEVLGQCWLKPSESVALDHDYQKITPCEEQERPKKTRKNVCSFFRKGKQDRSKIYTEIDFEQDIVCEPVPIHDNSICIVANDPNPTLGNALSENSDLKEKLGRLESKNEDLQSKLGLLRQEKKNENDRLQKASLREKEKEKKSKTGVENLSKMTDDITNENTSTKTVMSSDKNDPLEIIEATDSIKGTPFRNEVRQLAVDLYVNQKIPVREISCTMKKVLNMVGLELNDYPSRFSVTNFLIEAGVLDLAISGKKIMTEDTLVSLNQDGSTFHTGATRNFNVIQAELTKDDSDDSEIRQISFHGLASQNALAYANTVKERFGDIKNIMDKLGIQTEKETANPHPLEGAAEKPENAFSDKIVNTKSDRCAVNPATSKILQEEGLIDENSLNQYCTTHPLFEVSSAINKVHTELEKKHPDYKKNSTLFSKRGDGDFLTLQKGITKMLTSDPHASAIVSYMKKSGINIASKWGRDVGDRLNQTYSRCETLLAHQEIILESIQRTVKPSQRNIVCHGDNNQKSGSLIGGVEIGLTSKTTKDMCIAGTIINQAVMEPLRNISSKDFFNHADEIHEGIKKLSKLIGDDDELGDFIFRPKPIFGSSENQPNPKKIKPSTFIDSSNEDFVKKAVKSAFEETKKKLEGQLSQECAGNFTKDGLKKKLQEKGVTDERADMVVTHLSKLQSNNMNIESAVGQSKYFLQKAPNMSLSTIDARSRIKMNKMYDDDEFRNLQHTLNDSTLRKTAREFRKEMQSRNERNIDQLIESAENSVLGEFDNKNKKLAKKSELIMSSKIFTNSEIQGQLSEIENKKLVKNKEKEKLKLIKQQLTLRSSILGQPRVFFSNKGKQCNSTELREKLCMLSEEELPPEAKIVMEAIGNPKILRGRNYEESGFKKNGERYVEIKTVTENDLEEPELLIAKLSEQDIKLVEL